MNLEINNLYEFGEFNLDKKERILRRGKEPLTLSPKAFELLTFFVENPGRLIEKEELMKKLWADSFVEESNLTFNIGQLRKILGDRPQRPAYIKTIPRFGYRFIASVKKIANENLNYQADEILIPEAKEENLSDNLEKLDIAPASREADERKPQKVNFTLERKREETNSNLLFTKTTFLVAAILIFSIVTVIVATNLLWNKYANYSTAPILSADYKSQPMTNAGGVYEAAISPDGKIMAYLNEIGGKTGVWLKRFETGESTQIIEDTDDAYYGLSFSNSGEELYFSRGPKIDEGRQINIYKVSILGGIPKETVANIRGLFSISPDDKQVSYVRCLRQDTDFCSLFVADIDGKNERKLLTRPRPMRMEDNQFSPDGKSIAIAVGQSRTSSSEVGLVEVDIASGNEREITDHKFSVIQYLRWLPDMSGLLISAYEPPNNSVKIYQISREGNQIQLLTKDSISYQGISLDKAGRKMVATQTVANFRLWTASTTDPQNAKAISQAAPPMYYGQSLLTYTANGNIVFASGSDSNQQIWIMNSDGSNQRQLTSAEGTNWQPRLSADQKRIYFTSNRTGSAQIWRMNLDGSNQTQITDDKVGSRPIFIAPDEKTIYFEAARDSNLVKLSLGEDGKYSSSVVSQERIFQPEVNPTGDTVVYFGRSKGQYFQITMMSLADGKIIKTFPLADEKSFPLKIVWSPDGKSLYYLMRGEKNFKIWKHSIETEKSEVFADLGEERAADFSLSPDGKSFSFARGREFHDAFLIEGLK